MTTVESVASGWLTKCVFRKSKKCILKDLNSTAGCQLCATEINGYVTGGHVECYKNYVQSKVTSSFLSKYNFLCMTHADEAIHQEQLLLQIVPKPRVTPSVTDSSDVLDKTHNIITDKFPLNTVDNKESEMKVSSHTEFRKEDTGDSVGITKPGSNNYILLLMLL